VAQLSRLFLEHFEETLVVELAQYFFVHKFLGFPAFRIRAAVA
jgi:hypothetical protein